jgi:hypothetical protein
MRRLFIAGMFVILVHPALKAQDEFLPVVKPEDILVDSSQVVERLPLVNIDDSTRTFYYFDSSANAWEAYPYPDELEAIEDVRYHVHSRSDGTYVINPRGFWGFSQTIASEVWIFDPATGGFSRPDAACGLMQALPGDGQWVIIEDEELGESFLCFTETGERSPPIPSLSPEFRCLHNFRQPMQASPDNRWVLVVCGGLQFDAHSYNTETQQFYYLGRSTERLNENVEVIQWVNGTEAIIHSYPSWNPPGNTYYVADATRPDSLEFITWQLYAAPFYFNSPSHLEWMPCEFGGCGGPPIVGGLRYYDFKTGHLTIYPRMDGVYGISDVIPDESGDRLIRSLNYQDRQWIVETAPSATLRLIYGRS